MFVLCVIVSSILAFLVMGMGAAQLNGVPQAVEVMKRVGAGKLVRLSGTLLLLAALGLIIGLFWAPIGVAASAGLVLYFLVAVGFHIKIHDSLGQILNPLVPAAIAAIALWLRLATM